MTAIDFPEATTSFTAPPDLAESQVATVRAYCGPVPGGSLDGEKLVVVAWLPSEIELAAINAGNPIFVTMLGGLAPHFLTTDFRNAVNPA